MCTPTEAFLLGLGSSSIVGRSSTCVMPALSTYIGEELAKKAAHAKGRIKAYEMRAKMRGEQAVFRRLKKRRLAQGNCLLIDFASWGFESSVKKSQKQLGASRLAGSVVFIIFFFFSLSLSPGVLSFLATEPLELHKKLKPWQVLILDLFSPGAHLALLHHVVLQHSHIVLNPSHPQVILGRPRDRVRLRILQQESLASANQSTDLCQHQCHA